LMEKVWAKASGTYDAIDGGAAVEAYDFILGCPT
jgi:hypothetical protein